MKQVRSWVPLIVIAGLLAIPAQAAAFGPLTPQFGTGTAGGGAGQISSPEGFAVDASGNVYIADFDNNRIDVFAADGSFQRTFGWGVQNGAAALQVCTAGCLAGIAGGGTGQLNEPTTVAVDSSGNLYVGDFNNARISVYKTDGTFVKTFGWNVQSNAGALQVCTTGCQQGLTGGGTGQLDTPRFIVLDSSGNLYVSDSSDQRISVFTTDGGFVRTFGWGVQNGAAALQVCTSGCQVGLGGGGAGQLSGPRGLVLDGAGNLFVAEADNNRISLFTTGGDFIRTFGWNVQSNAGVLQVCISGCQQGLAGAGAGQLDGPRGLAADAAGNLYTADQNNNRVSEYTPAGGFVRAFGKAVVGGDPVSAGFDICTTACQIGQTGTGPGEMNLPHGMEFDCRGNLYVSEFGDARVQKFGDTTATPPCPPPAGKPSNQFSFGKLKRNKKKGTAKLAVILPGAGTIKLSGKGVKAVTRNAAGSGPAARAVTAAGTVKLAIKAKGKSKKKLNKRGKLKVKIKATFTPTGGDANSKTKKVKLIKTLRPAH